MTVKEIHDMIKLVNRLDLTEFKMRDGEFELSIRTKNFGKLAKPELQPIPMMTVGAPAAAPAAAPIAAPALEASSPASADSASDGSDDGLIEVKSPIVGTFYRTPSPDKPAYVKVGDVIEVGSIVCIVEAMKLFNEIDSEVAGKIVKVMVEDASPVQYDQVLFLVDPKG